MKKMMIVLMMALGLNLNAERSHALVAGFLTSGTLSTVLLIWGGVGTVVSFGFISAHPGSDGQPLLLGILMDADSATVAQSLRAFSPDEVLSRVQDGTYSDAEAQVILSDLARLNSEPEQRSLHLDPSRMTAVELSHELSRQAGIAPITAEYVLSSLGIQPIGARR